MLRTRRSSTFLELDIWKEMINLRPLLPLVGKFSRVSVKSLQWIWYWFLVAESFLVLAWNLSSISGLVLTFCKKSRFCEESLAKSREVSQSSGLPRHVSSFPDYLLLSPGIQVCSRLLSVKLHWLPGLITNPKACLVTLLLTTFPHKYHSFKFTGLTIHSLNHSSRKFSIRNHCISY